MQLQTVYFGRSGLAHPPSWGVIDRRRPVGRAGLDLGRRRQRRYRHSPLPSRGKGPAKQHSSINRADARTDGGAHLRFRVIPIGGNRVDLCWFGQSAERLDRYTSTGQREKAIRNGSNRREKTDSAGTATPESKAKPANETSTSG